MQLFNLNPVDQPQFLPMTRREMDLLNWDALDILLISGDAYVDHPSFAMALLGRTLVAHGFRTGIITQPQWTSTKDITIMGRPRLFAGISAGAIDSMLAHYTAFRKKRSDDAYTPGGQAGARPNRATLVYTNLVQRAFPGLPIVLGGIEASLRRISHYDFWSNQLRKPLLLDAKADILVYGMGERPVVQIAQRLRHQQSLVGIKGTVTASHEGQGDIILPSHEEILNNPHLLMTATLAMEKQVHGGRQSMSQQVDQRFVLVQPPALGLSTAEMDQLYALPFTRQSHPSYTQPIAAQKMIQDSVTSHRGCGGGCSFCTLAVHQGRYILSRSQESIIQEIKSMTQQPGFKGQISDVGGPSANMWGASCARKKELCTRASCLTPKLCPHFQMDHQHHLNLLRTIRQLPGVRGVRVASGLRFDLALEDKKALAGFIDEFVGGQLKIAPEHISNQVLKLMRKPGQELFEKFLDFFEQVCRTMGKKQYIVPYLMSAFPGTTPKDMHELAAWLRSRNWSPRQVQCFIPIPGAVATAMFYAQITPQGHSLFVAQSDAQRLQQHRILRPPTKGKSTTRPVKKYKKHTSISKAKAKAKKNRTRKS